VTVTVRNPLPARGGTEAEPIAEAKLFAPQAFRRRPQRAIVADDYEHLAELNPAVQNASAALVWTGSWYEAEVAIDPFGRAELQAALPGQIAGWLHRFCRMGHDLRVVPARYVPLDLALQVCVLPHFQRAQVKAALLARFSNRVLPDGQRGFFHPDHLTFGEGLYLSRIIAAAQAVPGVASVAIRRFHRRFESPNHEIANGVLPLRANEIARLDNDPNYPERGQLEIQVRGGI
jgi:predicted phage baseplate assembly protein